jgi:rubrerythrin
MSSAALLFAYVAALLGGLSALVWFSEQRRRRFEPKPSNDEVFRCTGCGFVYTDDADVGRSRCPQCRTMNEAFRF